MGRRALRKIDPSLDLTRYLFEYEQLPAPFDLAEFCGDGAGVEVEVGSGKGLFLARIAAAIPERQFIGIEVARKYARFSAARLARLELQNARMISGDALRFFRERLASDSLEAVHVYFPDPWWKKRHRKRRVMRPEFLRDVERVLKVGGQLHFWTDVAEYYEESLEIISATTSLRGPHAVPESTATHDLDYRTHFERRMRLRNEPIYRAQFERA